MSRHFTGRRLGLLGREPSFRSLFFATLGSGLGTWLALVALQIDVLTRTHSPIWISALLIADILPMLLVGLVAAPLVDRLSRRRLMVGADLVRFAVFCALPFAPNATTIVALAAVIGTATGFFRPAVYAGLPNLVSDEDLPQANSLLQTIDNSTWAIGSLAGGALVAASGPDLAYWINAATYRNQIFDKASLGMWISPGKHGRLIRQKYLDRGIPCPVVATVLTMGGRHSPFS